MFEGNASLTILTVLTVLLYRTEGYTGFLPAGILDGRAFRSESWIVTE